MSMMSIYLLPVALFVLMPATFIITYLIAVSLGHVAAGFPYISDTGTYSPESCIFSQSLNIIGLMMWLFGWVRYAQVRQLCGTELSFNFTLMLNRVAFWLMTLASIGTSIVGNFQETNLLFVHIIGAGILFFPALCYTWCHAFISYWTIGVVSTRFAALLRLFFAALGTLLFVVMGVTVPLSFIFFKGTDYRKWRPEDGGFAFHVISTVSEWLICIGFALYMFTFTAEFQELQIEPAEIRMRSPIIEGTEHLVEDEEEEDGAMRDEDGRGDEGGRGGGGGGGGVATPVEEQLYRPIVVRTEPYRELYA